MPQICFKSSVPMKLREILQEECAEYMAKLCLTADEINDLYDWVADGRSPYCNPANVADWSGREMDYVQWIRVQEGLEGVGFY